MGVKGGRKAHQQLWLLSGFQIPLLCLSISQLLQQRGSRDGESEREIVTEGERVL